jgi:cytochrome b561
LIQILHWLIAGMIVALLAMSTLVMHGIPDGSPEKIDALRRHMMTGGLVFVLTLLRFVMRRRAERPPALSSGMAWADALARAVHRLFDATILVMIGSGVTMAVLGGLPRVVFFGRGPLPDLESLPLLAVHRWTAAVIFAMLVLHAGGAFFHEFILRDRLLARMGVSLPLKSEGGREKGEG